MASKRAAATRKGKSASKAAPRKAARAPNTEAPEVDAEALAARARDLALAFRAKLLDRDPELAREFAIVLRAHTAVMVALIAGEVADLRSEIG